MSALAHSVPHVRAMREADLDQVVEIETAIYTHPWTRGNFMDSIQAGYNCNVMEVADECVGYGVQMIAVMDAHLLNLSIAEKWWRHGYGRSLLLYFIDAARRSDVLQVFLEVRPSNVVGRRLYTSIGFREVAVRSGYYPARRGREDAILMGLTL